MAKFKVEKIFMNEQIIYGLWHKAKKATTNDDMMLLSQKTVLPFFVLSRNHHKENEYFDLFIGSTIEKTGLESLTLPAGEYVKITIQPRWRIFTDTAIDKAKRYFYNKWLFENPYVFYNLEYVYYNDKSLGKKPIIDVYFAVQKMII